MAKPPEFREIVPQEFKEDEQELVGKIAEPYNDLVRQTISALNKNLTFGENIDSQIAVHQHIGGQSSTFQYNRSKPPVGMWIIDIRNQSTPNETLTSAPFPQWDVNEKNQIVINNVTGLTVDNVYQITFLIITG